MFLRQLKVSCPFAWGSFPVGLRPISLSSYLMEEFAKTAGEGPGFRHLIKYYNLIMDFVLFMNCVILSFSCGETCFNISVNFCNVIQIRIFIPWKSWVNLL